MFYERIYSYNFIRISQLCQGENRHDSHFQYGKYNLQGKEISLRLKWPVLDLKSAILLWSSSGFFFLNMTEMSLEIAANLNTDYILIIHSLK